MVCTFETLKNILTKSHFFFLWCGSLAFEIRAAALPPSSGARGHPPPSDSEEGVDGNLVFPDYLACWDKGGECKSPRIVDRYS